MDEKCQTLKPLGRLCMTIGQLPASYVESMSYYEQLIWLTKFLQEQVIPVVNHNSSIVNELQDYVEHYFDNLDVQEEINNKLDEMAESGQLTDIIAQYLGLAGMITFNNVAEMKAAENLVNGSKCSTLGYYEVNDGGNATYKVRTITNEDVVDEGSIIALNDDSLIAELIISDEINIKQFGAKGDGTTDDTNAFKNAISLEKPIYVPNGDYVIKDNLTIRSNLRGENNYSSHLLFDSLANNTYGITLGVGYLKVINLRITSTDTTQNVGTNIAYNGINTTGKLYINLDNLYITNFNIGVNLGINCWNNTFNTIRVTNCNTGIYLSEECNDDTFYDCIIKACKKGFHKIHGTTVNIIGGDFSYNEIGIILENHGDLNIYGTYFELNSQYSISATWGMNAFDKISVKNCSFTENNATTRIFYFNGTSTSSATIENCYFRNVGDTNITMCQYQTSSLKPIFIDNVYNSTFVVDTTRAEYINSKVYNITSLTTNQFTFTANGIGFYIYTAPSTPTGYRLLTKDFIRTDAGSFNLVTSCPIDKSYISYDSSSEIEVTGYIKCTYINL